jgi:hypothetical protein
VITGLRSTTLDDTSGLYGFLFVVQAHPFLRKLVRLPLHSRLLRREALRDVDVEPAQEPEDLFGTVSALAYIIVRLSRGHRPRRG